MGWAAGTALCEIPVHPFEWPNCQVSGNEPLLPLRLPATHQVLFNGIAHTEQLIMQHCLPWPVILLTSGGNSWTNWHPHYHAIFRTIQDPFGICDIQFGTILKIGSSCQHGSYRSDSVYETLSATCSPLSHLFFHLYVFTLPLPSAGWWISIVCQSHVNEKSFAIYLCFLVSHINLVLLSDPHTFVKFDPIQVSPRWSLKQFLLYRKQPDQ